MWRCPAGCGGELDFSCGIEVCVDCGKQHCHRCAYRWPVGDGDNDVVVCKRHYRIRQVMASRAGEEAGD